jgi:hypothetical protein
MTTANLLDRILGQLGELRGRCPELRFGQLIAIIGELAQDETGHSLWDVEDADFATALERFARDMARRESDRAERDGTPAQGGIGSTAGSTAPKPPHQVNSTSS